MLAKHGRTGEARREIDEVKAAMAGDGSPDPMLECDLVLVDAHTRVYEDRPLASTDARRLLQVLETLPNTDPIGQALALNHLCGFSLHRGLFDRAQEYAESAIRFYRQGGAEFGSLHLHTHLGQIKLLRGDLHGAEEQYTKMESRLADLPDAAGGLMAVCRALRSEVAYEMNDLRQSAELLADALASIEENDAWLDVRAAAYRVRTRLAFARAGLPGALTELAHCERLAVSRDMPRLRRLMQIERIRALTLSGELDAALSELRAIGLSPDQASWDKPGDWALRQGTTAVTIARWLVRARRAGEALNFLEPAEDFAIRGGQLLSLAKLRVIRATAHWKLNRKKDATSALLSALRLLGRQPFRRFILDEGREVRGIVQAALDGDHVTVQPGPQLRRSLSELTHYWVTKLDADVAEEGRGLQDNRVAGRDDGHRTRYLELLALGHSNKEIGRIMGVSVNTVKYHLKPIFKDLRADNRLRAVHRARELGILEA